ncbi:A/G-specific adenine glycosylase [Capnocytophaga sp. HP1101]
MTNWLIDKLISWYSVAQRQLPWRGTTDPYKVWLSEVILQQTRVVQGLPYYERFIAQYPTVIDLANAPEEQVLKLWQGLGYYSRAKNLHHTAQYIAAELGGKFPQTYAGLLKLKGIGDYTASAIASFCYNEPCPVVDGNVYRVLSRLFGISTPINSPQGAKEFKTLAHECLDLHNPGTYNQALMEFGALQCTPQSPDCNTCVLRDHCWAFHHNKVNDLPVKLKKITIKKRYFNYLVWLDPLGQTRLQKRQGKDIWHGLYEFPLLETLTPATLSEIAALHPTASVSLYNETPVIHKLTHQHLYTSFWILTIPQSLDNAILISDIHNYPVSALTANFITKFW